VPVFCLLNGDSCYSTRGEITDAGGFQRENSQPEFQSIHFSNPTIGYACYGGSVFKNSTGLLSIVNQVIQKNTIQIVPNPASDNITISFTNSQNMDFSVTIKDFLGKVIFSKSFQYANQTTINTDSFAKGVYFLTVVNQEKTQTKKLIIS
jgi:Secretion system C-terminal sorting domain